MMENIRRMKDSFLAPDSLKEDNSTSKTSYTITVTTGSMKYAGTDSNVFVGLTGASGEKTGLVKLDNSFRDDFERGSVDKFKVKLKDIGIPVILTLKHEESGMFSDWFAVSVTVQKSGTSTIYPFPISMWVSGVIEVPIGTAKLPHQEENPILSSFRKQELESKRQNIKWRLKEFSTAKGLPGFILADSSLDLPRNFRLDEGMLKDFDEVKKPGKNTIFSRVHEVFDKLENVSELKNLFSHPKLQKIPDFQQNWERDEEFGRQMMNGCDPAILKRCEKLPKKFPVTNELIASQLTRGISLDQEIKNGNVYIIDLAMLEGVPCGKNPLTQSRYYSCAPMCLLYINGKKNLVPIAIQLWQQPGPNNPIWTPDDSNTDWLLAKIFFRNAESNLQLIVEKIFRTHLILEPFAVALHRCLSSCHPVYKLLAPHLRYVCGGNVVIRSLLINQDGVLDRVLSFGGGSQMRLLRSAFDSFRFEQMNIRKLLKANGTDKSSTLPGYYYRDDAFALWDATQKFVKNILSIFYTSNQNVKLDQEIQNFVREIRNEGFLWEDGNDRGIPDGFATLEQLVEFVTSILFTSSCGSAAVTNGIFDIFINIPNAPMSMILPPPHEKGKTSHETIIQSLPSKPLGCMQMSFCQAYSKPAENQIYLADYPKQLFCDDIFSKIVMGFKDDLQQISSQIRSRNESSSTPYEYLLPERIPFAISL